MFDFWRLGGFFRVRRGAAAGFRSRFPRRAAGPFSRYSQIVFRDVSGGVSRYRPYEAAAPLDYKRPIPPMGFYYKANKLSP